MKKVKPTADARVKLLRAGLDVSVFNEDGTLDMDFDELATEYWVRTVPGSLVEMEDEKQLRILNQLFVPLSQAMPALAAAQDQQMLAQAAKAMQYIIGKQIELSGSTSAKDIGLMWNGDVEAVDERDRRIATMEEDLNSVGSGMGELMAMNETALTMLQEQVAMLRESQQLILEKLGMQAQSSTDTSAEMQQRYSTPGQSPSNVVTASA